MMKKIILLFFTAVVSGYFVSINAQEIQGGIDFQIGFPVGDFRDQIDKGKPGVGFWGGYRFKGTPLMLGLDLGVVFFGRDKREVPLSPTIPDIIVEVVNRYNFVQGDLIVRLISQDSDAAIRPYADALFGLNYLYTETVLRERGSVGDEGVILRDTNFEDTALNYGFGGGIQIRLFTHKPHADSGGREVRSLFLYLSGRYLVGGKAEYLQPGSIIIENGEASYDIHTSRTDMIYAKVGLGVVF